MSADNIKNKYFSGRRVVVGMGLGAIALLLPLQVVFASVEEDIRFETSTFMKDTVYQHPDHLATDIAPSGAESPINIQWDQSHTGKWYIEQQRYGSDAVCAGVAKEDPAAIERGLKILQWGFEQQQANGSFDCPDAFHSTSFFVEAAAHACLVLSASQYADQYASAIQLMKPAILKGALWMTLPAVAQRGKRSNLPYTHRFYLVAGALGEAGLLCENQGLIDASKVYIREGVDVQDPSGFNPEKGGYDCSYHAVGLFYAERYYNLVADKETKEQLFAMLKKGYAWLRSRIRPDGTIDATGSTRISSGQEKSRNGEVKKINYGYTYRGLYRWSLISGDAGYEELAEKVLKGEDIYKHQISPS
jgi:hypothetical protein